MRKLPELSDDPPEEIDQIKDRDVFDVRINYKNQLLVEGKSIDISRLREKAKEFIENPNNSDDLPQKEEIDVPFFGVYPVSKQVISLQNDRGTKYDIYIQVQNELTAAYNELRDEISKKQFHNPFDKLDEEEMKAVKKIYPMRISEAEPRRSTGGGS
jgi:biopolymer transport protein ExbD